MQSAKRLSLLLAAFAAAGASSAAFAEKLPAIAVSASNALPACATPGRLQAYLEARNPALDARFRTIAVDYMREGEALGVRWDIAFHHMILETGQLTFKNGNRAGDVKAQQNNFAGLGATGGVPGESFADVATGVRAHLQHLLLYAGVKLDTPVAERTRKVQEWGVLVDWQKGFKQPITFADMAAKWAPKSKAYVDSLEQIAEKFDTEHCRKPDPHPEYVAEVHGASAPVLQASVPPAAEKPAKPNGAELAQRAAADSDGTRSALGAANATSGAAVKILNAPSFDAPPATKVAATGAGAKAMPPQKDAGVAPPAVTAPTASPAVPQAKCKVWTASYGGQRAVIVKSMIGAIANFTVLDVNEGQESREADAFIAAYAKGGAVAGEFADQNKALEKAFALCPEG